MKETVQRNENPQQLEWKPPKAIPADYSLNDADMQRIFREENQRIDELEAILDSINVNIQTVVRNTTVINTTPSHNTNTYYDDLVNNAGTFNHPREPWDIL